MAKNLENHIAKHYYTSAFKEHQEESLLLYFEKVDFLTQEMPDRTPKASPRVLKKLKIFQNHTLSTPNATAKELQIRLRRQRIDADPNALRRARLQFKRARRIPYERSFQYIPSYCNLFSLLTGNGLVDVIKTGNQCNVLAVIFRAGLKTCMKVLMCHTWTCVIRRPANFEDCMLFWPGPTKTKRSQ
ncbi:hypothetical protein XU18_2091 [Perkinsela sp. CCAP 1560/4]|nr:hypothetical protein XU18_2091 [Perkinsela sp. CCAP 1560/4]|eukprot:KNH07228.1 hypothetical protein XU18_2091 [Perkinsela sp. CCAP 1560/4]